MWGKRSPRPARLFFLLFAASIGFSAGFVPHTVAAQTYTYVGQPLPSGSSGCPASVGNITATLDQLQGHAQAIAVTALGIAMPGSGYYSDVTNGQLSWSIQGSAFSSIYQTMLAQSNFNVGVPNGDILTFNFAGGVLCQYVSQAAGTWSGAMFAGPIQTLGMSAPPSGPESLPPSPVTPIPAIGHSVSGGCSDPQSPTPQQALPPAPLVSAMCGNPINAATGNKFEAETDFIGGTQTGLEFIRYYNSQDTAVTSLGARWRTTWQRSLNVSGNTVTVPARMGIRTFSRRRAKSTPPIPTSPAP